MDATEELTGKIKILHETVWERRASRPELDKWLANFAVGAERIHALWLLSQFMYFGQLEMRELLRALFRDLVKYPLVESIRRDNGDTQDTNLLRDEFKNELKRTRFLGMGNPSESGCHLLYYFRQENGLPKTLFIYTHEIFQRFGAPRELRLRFPDVKRYIYIDDFCGSGDQAITYSRDVLQDVKRLDSSAKLDYYVLFATESGLETVRQGTGFNRVEAVFVLDDSYKCFAPQSRYFAIGEDGPQIDKDSAEAMCRSYGAELYDPEFPLGYKDGQLLLGFAHNTPDNTLPIIWSSGGGATAWTPIFRRYPKVYTWEG